MDRKMTTARLVLAIISTTLEEGAIYVIWRWLLPEFDVSLPFPVIVGIMAAWAAFAVSLFVFTTRTLKKQIPVGLPSMVGTKGKVVSPLAPEGLVRIKSELWVATAVGGDIAKNDEVEVVGEDGLKLVVRKTGDSPPKH
jgi:membrane-bound ClpP family serine protease